MILPNGVYFDETQQPVRPLHPTRRRKPKTESAFHAFCPRCWWRKSDKYGRFLLHEARYHVCPD